MKSKDKQLLTEWLGEDNVQQVDQNIIRDQVPDGVWGQVFSVCDVGPFTSFDWRTLDGVVTARCALQSLQAATKTMCVQLFRSQE